MSDDKVTYWLMLIVAFAGGASIGFSTAHYEYSGDAERQQQIHRLKCAQHTSTQTSLEWCLCGREGCE